MIENKIKKINVTKEFYYKIYFVFKNFLYCSHIIFVLFELSILN